MKFIKYSWDSYLFSQTRNIYRNGQGHRKAISMQNTAESVKPFESIPGLSTLPVIGSLHHFLPVVGEIGPNGLFSKFGDFHEKYGAMAKLKILDRANFVIMFEPDLYEQVFKSEEVNPLRPGFQTLTYYREEMRQNVFKGVYGLSTAQGSKWRDFRTKVNPAMLKPKLVKLYTPGLEEIADEIVAKIIKQKDQKELLKKNFDKEIKRWSLEAIALVGLGARLGCLQDNLPEDHPSNQLIKALDDMLHLVIKLEFRPSLWKHVSTSNFKKIVKTFDSQWDISKAYLNETLERIKSRGHDIPEEDKSIVEKLLAIDENVAIMMANEMLMAGIDTVTIATLVLLNLLAVNQDKQDKLREEIISGLSTQYLRACLKESMRMIPVVPTNLRRTSKEHVVGGYQIPKGIEIIAPNQYLANHEKYYPRAKEFLPERWLVDKTDPLYHGNVHPMVTMPFGFGVRSCIGRRIAELEIETFIKKLIPKLKVTWNGPPLKVKSMMLNEIQKPYSIEFESI